MAKSEKAVLNETLCGLSAEPETMVWRNNTGSAWQGKRREAKPGTYFLVEPNMVILAEARPVKFGLVGSSDIIGSSKGRALAVEVKDADGRQDEAQILFERAWVKAGGIYILARSREQAIHSLRDYI